MVFLLLTWIVLPNNTDFEQLFFTVSDTEDPPPQFEGHVDIEEFWQSVDQEIICRGFLQSKLQIWKCILQPYLEVFQKVYLSVYSAL